ISILGRSEEEEKRSAGRSTNCSVSSSKSHFYVPKDDFVRKFKTIKIKANEMVKNFRSNFVKTGDNVKKKCVLEPNSSPLTEKLNMAHSTITIKAGTKLNPNYEPYVPTGSLEQASINSSHGLSDSNVKPFDPQEFYQKITNLGGEYLQKEQ
ncbi:hypothetical protein R6Q57_021365, partial [Mikania cordata]